MFPEIFAADSYEVFQIGSEVVLIAKTRHTRADAVMFFEKTPTSSFPPEYTLLREPLIEGGSGIGGTSYECLGFKAFHAVEPLHTVRIHDRAGVRGVQVRQQPKGFTEGGVDLELPVVPASAPCEQVIGRMKSLNRRAVVVAYGVGQHELFMNYQVARAFTGRTTLAAMRGMGQPVAITEGGGRPSPRMHLFSMEWPAGRNVGRIRTLFESVGGSVASTSKVCLCSSENGEHTVLDQSPTLDAKPCAKAPPGHGTYSCF